MERTEVRFRELSRLEYRLFTTPLSPQEPVLVVEFAGFRRLARRPA